MSGVFAELTLSSQS